jgi:nicotinamidase-related amidase
MRKFELALHPDKTRLIRFGRHAAKQREKLGEGATLCPPAIIIDKTRYSAFTEPTLLASHLREREADALIVSGSETDVCVLATVLDAVDSATA